MNTFPTRHGDWHLIDGQLVDLSQSPLPESSDTPEAVTGSDIDGEPSTPSLPPFSPPASKRRNKPSED